MPRFFKSRVSGTDLLAKTEVPGTEFAKICVSGAEKAKIGKADLEFFFFFLMEVGSLELENGLKKWVSGAKKLPVKRVS